MEYDEGVAIVSQFKEKYPYSANSPHIHGIQVAEHKGVPVIQLLLYPEIDASILDSEERGDDTFEYTFGDQSKTISTEIVSRAVPRAHALAGSSARGAGMNGIGTAGWNIYFFQYNAYVCLSNWHVLCGQGNNTPLGTGVEIDGLPIATLYTFKELRDQPGNNIWDYAIARYGSHEDCEGRYRLCGDSVEHPYPKSLGKRASIDSTTYRKVGNRSPVCREGNLIAFGDRSIMYNDGVVRLFTGQLIFTKMSDPGDSGSVFVNTNDNTVVGLCFAGNSEESLANPLFKLGWGFTGSVIRTNGVDIPMLSGSPFLSFGDDSASIGSTGFDSAGQLQSFPVNFEPPPSIPVGKLYLGTAIEREWNWQQGFRGPNGELRRWIHEIPPVSPSGNSYVLVGSQKHWISSPNNSSGGALEYTDNYYMVFG